MNLALRIDGKLQFDGALHTLGEKVKDWRDAWPEIEQVFYRIQKEQFDSEGARGGSRWAALTPAYKKWKEAHYPGQPILVLTGRLRRSLSVIGNQDTVREHEPMSLALGTRTPYAIFHQRRTRKMKQRPPLQINRNDIGKIISRLYRFAERGARDVGFEVQA